MGREGSYLKAQECKFWQVDDTLYVEATLHHYQNSAGNIVSCMGKGSALMSFNAEGSSPRTGYGEITLRTKVTLHVLTESGKSKQVAGTVLIKYIRSKYQLD